MNTGTITSKGQITIPAQVRAELALNTGDKLLFVVEDERLVVIPMRQRRLTDYFAALPGTRPYPGTEEMRREVGEALGRQREEADEA